MKANKKTILIIGAAVAAGGLWYYHRKKQREANEPTVGLEPAITAPVSQGIVQVPESFTGGGGGSGGGGMTGGGAPTTITPGVTTVPPQEHQLGYKEPNNPPREPNNPPHPIGYKPPQESENSGSQKYIGENPNPYKPFHTIVTP